MNHQPLLCLYEDNRSAAFKPITYLRPVWDIRGGAFTFRERIEIALGSSVTAFLPIGDDTPRMADGTPIPANSDLLLLNGRAVFSRETLAHLLSATTPALFTINGGTAALRLSAGSRPYREFIADRLATPTGLPVTAIEGKLFDFIYELPRAGGVLIENDLQLRLTADPVSTTIGMGKQCLIADRNKLLIDRTATVQTGAVIENSDNLVLMETDSAICAGAILDTTNGSIWLGKGAVIEPGAIIQGPCYIGDHSIVRPGAKLADGVCLGPHCRVGGEVSKTTLLAFSNKQHSGYLGNSYLGEWVNLGAATDNSDLKNNYRPVTITIEGVDYDTGDLHIGSIIGDFVKTAIHTRLNTGTVIGTCVNLFGIDFPPKEIPPFTWVASDNMIEHRLNKALETNRVVMPRKGAHPRTGREADPPLL